MTHLQTRMMSLLFDLTLQAPTPADIIARHGRAITKVSGHRFSEGGPLIQLQWRRAADSAAVEAGC